MRGSGGIASGVLMLLAGAFLVLRTVRRPAGGRNLVDLILGGSAQADAAATAAQTSNTNSLLNLPSLTQAPQTSSPVKSNTTTNGNASKSIANSTGTR